MYEPRDATEAFSLPMKRLAHPEKVCLNLLSLDLTGSKISMAKLMCSKPLHNLFLDVLNEPHRGRKNYCSKG